ncbi:hypothetical protein O0I10_002636 [Lichtheimia ornata]|uniref:Uncharacterized protein n=1 Tax=Lichtheimia ornata TaxID=688661 RepID=A0AAD7VA50_9FUNG|nr:uncharacterized protein O0I10_002636 [Lichtheimia ornata]KAJ8661827.1 hypothetical protein O0I10_002636 [Lichtheimia ornata]
MTNLDPSQAANAHIQERLKRRIHSPQSMAPNLRSRQLHVMTWAVSLPLVGYVALFADFGEQEHCFSPLRRWFDEKRKRFWSLTPEEEASLRSQGQMK